MNLKKYVLLTRRTRVQLSRLYLLYYFKHFFNEFFFEAESHGFQHVLLALIVRRFLPHQQDSLSSDTRVDVCKFPLDRLNPVEKNDSDFWQPIIECLPTNIA